MKFMNRIQDRFLYGQGNEFLGGLFECSQVSENCEDEEAVKSESCTYALGDVPVPVRKVSRF